MPDLTDDEKLLMAYYRTADQWDGLWHEITLLLPVCIIIGLGFWFQSSFIGFTDVVILVGIRVREVLTHRRWGYLLQSIANKLHDDEMSQHSDAEGHP